ncbi:MAG: hypothetical protein ABI158_02935, partial [Edaphobacter sp.]
RKSFLHASWSEASLASELSGSSALARIQSRVSAYWDRQFEKRTIATLLGVLASNVANNSSDIVVDISGVAGVLAHFNGASVQGRCFLADICGTSESDSLAEPASRQPPGHCGIPTGESYVCVLDCNTTAVHNLFMKLRRSGVDEL